MPFAKVLRKGQVTLPKKVRDVLNVSEGDLVDFEILGNAVILRPRVSIEKTETGLFANIRRMQGKIGDVDPEVMEKAIGEAIQDVRKQRPERMK